MITAGIALGLGAAVAQSLSYLLAKLFVVRREGGALRLAVLAHVWMGVMSLALIGPLWSGELPAMGTYGWQLLSVSFFYLVAQVLFFTALRTIDASRASPLLGVKIAMLAFIAVGLLGQTLTSVQWLAVGLCMVAAVGLNYSGQAIPVRAVVYMMGACLGFAISDLSIERLVHAMAPLPRIHAAALGVAMSYSLLGVVGAMFLPWLGSREARDWRHAFPYALAWLGGMLLLFGCFGLLGAVFGNMIQATRGLISVGMGACLARMGHEHVEQKVHRKVLVQRTLAAALMLGAIVLFLRDKL